MTQLDPINSARNLPKTIVAAAYTQQLSDGPVLADCTAGAIIITLLAAAQCAGLRYMYKKTDAGANTLTIDGAGAETIDAAATLVLATQNKAAVIVSNGTSWFVESVP